MTEKEIRNLDLSYLSEIQKQELLNVLLKCKRVFSNKPGLCNLTEHYIQLKEDFKPIRKPPYRIPHKLLSEVERQVSILLSEQKIERCVSPFAHPVVCVTKPNGEVRVCVDYRMLNSGTVSDVFPMPRIQDMLNNIAPARFISTLDAVSGYWQIPMAPECIKMTAFVTDSGVYAWRVMPFGLKCASNTFQRVACLILEPHRSYAVCYIDDVCVKSDTWTEHLLHLNNVFNAFIAAGMTLRLSKCVFAKSKVKFLGHLVGCGEIQLLPDRVEALKALVPPTTKKLVRSALGMFGFFRNFIPHFAEIALPFTELTK